MLLSLFQEGRNVELPNFKYLGNKHCHILIKLATQIWARGKPLYIERGMGFILLSGWLRPGFSQIKSCSGQIKALFLLEQPKSSNILSSVCADKIRSPRRSKVSASASSI